MAKKEPRSKQTGDLRKRAEKKVRKSMDSIGKMSTDEIKKLIHELQVHQIELEMQNDALRESQLEIVESRIKYTDLYDFAPVGYFTFDDKGHIIEANVTGASLLGFEKRSLIKTPFYRFINHSHLSIFQAHLQKAIEARSKQICKIKLTRKDGSQFDALVETVAVTDSNDKFDHYRTSVTDISEITKAEAEMARLASFPSLNPNPISEVDFKGVVHYLNPAAERLFPDLRQRGVGHPWLADWGSVVRTFSTGGKKVIIREVNVGGRWCEQTMYFVEDTERIRIYGMDITERKKKEEELNKLNRTLRAMSNSNHALLRSTNETEYLNEICRIVMEDCGHAMVWIGYAEDDEGKTVRPVAYAGFDEGYIEKLNITWADTERGRGPTGTAIRTGKPAGCANMLTDPLFALWRKDALERGYTSSMVLPLMAAGRAFGAITIYSRKPEAFSEDEVRLLSELAGDLAFGITMMKFRIAHAKSQEKLKEHTAQLEAANKELESFSYSVSHDLRAPLRAIDGYARMILKKYGDKFNEDALTKFNIIRSSIHMMGQLIDDLLTFSRLGRKHMSVSKIDIEALIGDVWKEQQAVNPDRNINFTVNSIPPGYADRTLIKQVYTNLLSNAVKFTKFRDPAYIEVGGHVDENENIYYVKDNGVGFDMTYYNKLFGVFQRLHNADDFEGTGIGLATVQRIISRHGGRVWAEGKVDKGATFFFSLPSSHTG
ncbi:MAG TPA: GAF domain-containing protein [Syntrophales bacterium]|nr:GAF domain-containing protein [Syntrophales bacterium]